LDAVILIRAFLLVALLGLSSATSLAQATSSTPDEISFVVDSLGDEPDADREDGRCRTSAQKCTLRAALQEASEYSYAAEVQFQVAGTIRVSRPLELQEGKVSIRGPGISRLRIDGDRQTSILIVRPGVSLTISDLTLSGGLTEKNGGAIDSSGSLTLLNVALEKNQAENGGAIANRGYLALWRVRFENNVARRYGGAISNEGGTVSASNSIFQSNSAETGAAISVFPALQISQIPA